MATESKQVIDSENSVDQLSQWAVRTRAVDQIFRSRLHLEEQQRFPYDKTLSRDLILRLIDLIKDV